MKNIYLISTDKPSRIIKSQDNDFILLNTNVPNWFEINLNTTKQNIYITSDEKIRVNDYITDGYKVWKWKDDSSLLGRKKIILTTDQDLINNNVQEIPDEFLEWFVKNPSCEEVEIQSQEKSIPMIQPDGDVLLHKYKSYKTIIPRTTQQIIDEDYSSGLTLGQIIPKEEPKQESVLKCELCKIYPRLEGTNKCESCYSVVRHVLEQNPKFKGKLLPDLRKKQETLEEAAMKMYPIKTDPSGYDINMFSRYGFYNGAKWQVEKTTITTDDAYSEGFENGKNWQKERLYTEEEVKEMLFHRETHYMKTAHHLHINEWFEQFKKK